MKNTIKEQFMKNLHLLLNAFVWLNDKVVTFRKIHALLALIFPLFLLAQNRTETKYFDYSLKECDSAMAKTTYVYQYDDLSSLRGKKFKYDSLKNLVYIMQYSNLKDEIKDGLSLTFFASGSIKTSQHYLDGELDGELKSYYENGQLKRKEKFRKGKSLTGQCFTSTGQDTTFYAYEVMPAFPGGTEGMMKFLAKNIAYPQNARDEGISGRVVVQFDIDADGLPKNTRILESVNPLLDAEAVRLVNIMPRWYPARVDGELVKVSFTLPVRFGL